MIVKVVFPPKQTLTFILSKKAKAEVSVTVNTYLYNTPDVVERLTQGHRRTVQDYGNRAAGHIMEFERAFAEVGTGKIKYTARM